MHTRRYWNRKARRVLITWETRAKRGGNTFWTMSNKVGKAYTLDSASCSIFPRLVVHGLKAVFYTHFPM